MFNLLYYFIIEKITIVSSSSYNEKLKYHSLVALLNLTYDSIISKIMIKRICVMYGRDLMNWTIKTSTIFQLLFDSLFIVHQQLVIVVYNLKLCKLKMILAF